MKSNFTIRPDNSDTKCELTFGVRIVGSNCEITFQVNNQFSGKQGFLMLQILCSLWYRTTVVFLNVNLSFLACFSNLIQRLLAKWKLFASTWCLSFSQSERTNFMIKFVVRVIFCWPKLSLPDHLTSTVKVGSTRVLGCLFLVFHPFFISFIPFCNSNGSIRPERENQFPAESLHVKNDSRKAFLNVQDTIALLFQFKLSAGSARYSHSVVDTFARMGEPIEVIKKMECSEPHSMHHVMIRFAMVLETVLLKYAQIINRQVFFRSPFQTSKYFTESARVLQDNFFR